MILVTGASGNAGAAVLAAVQQHNIPVTAMYRSRADAAKAPPDTPTAIADFADMPSLLQALQGIYQLYLVCSPIPQLVEFETNVIQAATQSGVQHIVLNSALGAGDYPLSFPSWHRQVEDTLKASGLGYTILRPNSFMQNILAYMAPSIRQQGAFYAAMGEAKDSFIDVGDLAAVAAEALLEPARHHNQIYELNGPEAVTHAELASRISRIAGRTVQFIDIPESAQRQSMLQLGMPAWQVDALLDLQRYYTGGQGGTVDNLLRQLLGREPVRLNDFLERNKASFTAETANK